MRRPLRTASLFPYTTLFRSEVTHVPYRNVVQGLQDGMAGRIDYDCVSLPLALPQIAAKTVKPIAILRDRKSTRLNSSHPSNSYAGFCFKKKDDGVKEREGAL